MAGSAFWLPLWEKATTEERRPNLSAAHLFAALADACAALELKPTDSLLEVGCGSGTLSRRLFGCVAQYDGMDASAEALNLLKREDYHEYGYWRRWILTPARLGETLPYADASFDKVLVGSVLQYLSREETEIALRELARVTKPGGLCFLQTNPDLRKRDAYLAGCPSERHEQNLKAQWIEPAMLVALAHESGWASASLRPIDSRIWLAPYYFDMLLEKRI